MYAQYSILKNTVKQQDLVLTVSQTWHLASSYNATAKRTLEGLIWGSTRFEELKIRTM